uniref:Uncharacterized protein n=1 Tax=Anguilla anguilla TaxID=7936 RepID=A0A0E9SBB7_ANGAN
MLLLPHRGARDPPLLWRKPTWQPSAGMQEHCELPFKTSIKTGEESPTTGGPFIVP